MAGLPQRQLRLFSMLGASTEQQDPNTSALLSDRQTSQLSNLPASDAPSAAHGPGRSDGQSKEPSTQEEPSKNKAAFVTRRQRAETRAKERSQRAAEMQEGASSAMQASRQLCLSFSKCATAAAAKDQSVSSGLTAQQPGLKRRAPDSSWQLYDAAARGARPQAAEPEPSGLAQLLKPTPIRHSRSEARKLLSAENEKQPQCGERERKGSRSEGKMLAQPTPEGVKVLRCVGALQQLSQCEPASFFSQSRLGPQLSDKSKAGKRQQAAVQSKPASYGGPLSSLEADAVRLLTYSSTDCMDFPPATSSDNKEDKERQREVTHGSPSPIQQQAAAPQIAKGQTAPLRNPDGKVGITVETAEHSKAAPAESDSTSPPQPSPSKSPMERRELDQLGKQTELHEDACHAHSPSAFAARLRAAQESSMQAAELRRGKESTSASPQKPDLYLKAGDYTALSSVQPIEFD